MVSVIAASTAASRETPLNTAARPTAAATAPITGPKRAPKTAAPIAVPIKVPRRSRGAAAISQEKAPAHVNALPMPCSRRAAISWERSSENAKPRLAAAISARPVSTARRGPMRAAATPPGSPPIRAPAA